MVNISAIKPTTLKTPLTSDAVEIVLREFVDRDGNAVEWSDLDTDWLVLIVKQADQWEQIKCDGLTQNDDGSATLDIATNGRHLLPIPPYTGSATGFNFSLADVVVGNDVYTMQIFANIKASNTWEQLQTFSVSPRASADAVASDELVRLSQLQSAVLGTLLSAPLVIPGNAGETVAEDQLVYLNSADSEWYKADADSASNVENVLLGMTRGAGTDGNAIANGITILGEHIMSGLTANTVYYASNTAGGISTSVGTKEVTVGISRSTTSLWFTPRFNQQLTEDQQDALAGTSGTPSSTNKFVTNDDTAEGGASKLLRMTSANKIPAVDGSLLLKLVDYFGGVGNLVAKTYYHIHLKFILWTGSVNDNAVTDYDNWVRTSEVVITPGGAMAQFTGTGQESLVFNTAPFAESGSADLLFSDGNKIIMDCWAKLPATSTGDLFIGFANDNGYFDDAYNSSTESRVGFHMRGSTGVIYATIAKNGVGITSTDVSVAYGGAIPNTSWNNFRIELDLSNNVLFYINNILVATLSGANLPSTGSVLVGFGRSNTAVFAVTAPNIALEMI